ncbi:MAG: hypothetical protein M1486_06785 [Gammaproteobacteria bacterium]|nr:hypothetical protein [Gammaproteobacteria bacterium]
MTILSTIKSTFLRLKYDGFNITSYIAKETEELDTSESHAIDKIIALGGNVEDAVYGFAFAGNVRQVNKLLENCPSAKQTVAIGQAIRGYVRAEHFDAVYEIPNYREYMKEMVIGLAQAGNKEKLQPILDKKIHFFAQAVEGYSEGNHELLLKKLIKGTCYYPQAIFYAARSGHTTLVNSLLADCGVSVDFKVESLEPDSSDSLKNKSQINAYTLLNHAVQGYASGRHFKEAAALLERGASIYQCISSIQDENEPQINFEPYFVLLSYVESKEIATQILGQIKLHSGISGKAISDDDEVKYRRVNNLMNLGMNYLDAAKKAGEEVLVDGAEQASKSSVDTAEAIDVTLPSLSLILNEELDLNTTSNAALAPTRC